MDGNAIWFVIRWLQTSLPYLSSSNSESRKEVDHIRQGTGFVLKNAPHHLARTQSSVLYCLWGDLALTSAQRHQEPPLQGCPPLALFSSCPIGKRFIAFNFFFS